MMRGVAAVYRHACALVAAGAVVLNVGPAPASAQIQNAVAPIFGAPDSRGVDVTTGQFRLTSAEVAIGQPGAGGLAFSRHWIGSGWRDSLAGTISSSGSVYTVSIGASSESFTLSGGTYTSDQMMGATLTLASGKYAYTMRDGTVAEFDTAAASCSGITSFWACNAATITKLTRPDGEVLTWTYTTATVGGQTARRPQSVSNTLGYQLHFTYANNNPLNATDLNGVWLQRIKTTGINRAYYFCADSATTCSDTSGGNWPYVTYGSEAGGIQTVADRLSQTTRYVINSNQLTQARLPTSSTAARITVGYRPDGKVGYIEQLLGSWSSASYDYSDASGIRTTTTTPYTEGGVEVAKTDLAKGWVTEGWADTSGTRKGVLTRDPANGRVTRVTQATGEYVNLTYDDRGNVTQTVTAPKTGSSLAQITTSAVYPASCTNAKTCNKPISTTDALGYRTDYVYDAIHGGVTRIQAPAPSGGIPVGTGTRPQTRISYWPQTAWYMNSVGSIVAGPSVYRPGKIAACATGVSPGCLDTADESVTTVNYQAGSSTVPSNILPTITTSRSGNTGTGAVSLAATMTYTVQGDVATVDGPLSGTADTAYMYYDDARRLRASVSPDPDAAGTLQPRITRYTYDAEGRIITVETGHASAPANWASMTVLQTVTNTFDSTLSILGKTALSSGGTTYAVQQYGIGPNFSRCTATRMNPAEFATLPADGCAADTAGSFGPDRFMISNYNAYAEGVSIADGSLDAYGSPSRILQTMQYGAASGTLDYLTDAGGNKTKYEYDGFSRLVKTTFPSPTTPGAQNAADYEETTYDAVGRITSVRGRDGQSTVFQYDNLGRVTLSNAPGTALDVSYTYDNLGRVLTKVQASQTITYVYDALSRLVSEQVDPSGVGEPTLTVGYVYDAGGRRSRLTWPDAFYVTYDYDTLGEVTAIKENGSTSLATFTYDNLGRRTSLTRGNGSVTGYTFDGASRLTDLALDLGGGSANDLWTDLDYNPAGQIVSRTTNNTGYNFTLPSAYADTYVDNGLNQYTSAGGVNPTYDTLGNMTNDGTKPYTYDVFSRLITAGASTTLSYDPSGRLYQVAGTTTTRFVYDGADIIAEYNTSGAVVRRYVHGTGVDEPLVWYEGAGTTDRRYLFSDERGSIVAIEGATTTKNTYDEYGVPGSGNMGRFQYTGQIWLSDVGLYHYKARAYNPELGRFMQNDPIGYGDGMNLYAYVRGDPINAVDPSGMQQSSSSNCPRDCVYPGVGPNEDGLACGPNHTWEECWDFLKFISTGVEPVFDAFEISFAGGVPVILPARPTWPTPGRCTLNTRAPGVGNGTYGWSRIDPRTLGPKWHNGIDITSGVGESVVSAFSGRVTDIRDTPVQTGYGLQVVVKSYWTGAYSLYAHLQGTTVQVGDSVRAGDQIGFSGKSGNAFDTNAPHLHYEYRTRDTANRSDSRDPMKRLPPC